MDTHDVPVRVDHVGIAVESVEAAEPVLVALGCERLVDETLEEFRWVYYELGDASRIELIEPTTDESFLRGYLDRYGPGLHHVTLEVGDIDRLTAHLEAAGIGVVDRREYPDWTEAYVSPQNPTRTVFQLMEYHDSYAASRSPGDRLFVHHTRVGDTA